MRILPTSLAFATILTGSIAMHSARTSSFPGFVDNPAGGPGSGLESFHMTGILAGFASSGSVASQSPGRSTTSDGGDRVATATAMAVRMSNDQRKSPERERKSEDSSPSPLNSELRPTPITATGVQLVNRTLPVYGFGELAGLRGGAGTTRYVVTSAADSGPGTYRDALSRGGRHITFDKALDGTEIRLASPVSASGSYLTLDGSGVDVTVSGFATKFSGTNIVVAGMAYRNLRGSSNEDAITFRGASTTQVFGVFGSVFESATDGLIDIIWNGGHDVFGTMCGNRFEHNDKAMLVHSGSTDREGGRYHITLCRNHWNDVYQRSPFSRDALVHQYNDVFENYGKPDGAGGGSKSGADIRPSEHLLQNNVARPRALGDRTFTGDSVTNPRREFAGPHSSGIGKIRIDGSLLLANGTLSATQLEHDRNGVFQPSYGFPLETSSTALMQAVIAHAGRCVPSAAVNVANPCEAVQMVSPGEQLQAVVPGEPSSVEFFIDGSSIGFGERDDAGMWGLSVNLPSGTSGVLSIRAKNPDGTFATSGAYPIAIV